VFNRTIATVTSKGTVTCFVRRFWSGRYNRISSGESAVHPGRTTARTLQVFGNDFREPGEPAQRFTTPAVCEASFDGFSWQATGGHHNLKRWSCATGDRSDDHCP